LFLLTPFRIVLLLDLIPTWLIRFPGSQPVSLLQNHMANLKANKFLVCEKSDGVRYLLLICNPMMVVKNPPSSWERFLGGKNGRCYFGMLGRPFFFFFFKFYS
jgi:hypothetical protein